MTSSSDNKNIPSGPVPVKLAEYVPVAASEREDRSGWIRHGDDNAFAEYLIDLADSSPTHGALVASIAQIIAGKEFTGIPSTVFDIKKLNALREPIAADLKLQGGFYIEVVWSVDGSSVVGIKHLAFELCRLSKNDDDEINGVFYSKDWAQCGKKKYKPVFIPIFKRKPKQGEEPRREVYIAQIGKKGRNYYGRPDYWPAVNWIELARQLGMFHVNNIMNGLFPSMILNFFNGEPDPDTKERITKDFERRLSGAKNSGKFWIQFNEPGVTAPQIDSFPVPEQEKIYQWQIDASNQQIMIGHRVTSPLLFGIRESGGGLGSNSDEIRQAFALFESQVIRPFQAVIETAINEILGITTTDIVPFVPGLLEQPATPAPTALEAEKKKCCEVRMSADRKDLSDKEYELIVSRLKDRGEIINSEEWELISDEQACGDHAAELEAVSKIELETLASLNSYANGDEKSPWGDSGLYKLRYAYSQNLSDGSRQFCVDMVALSKAGMVFRYEDIQAMGDDGVNGQFAPEGQNTYDIFTWKGGVYCHHFWKRQIYFRKREGGKFLPNKGLENDKRVANVPFVPQKGEEGIAPINTPTRGSLKNP